MKKKIVSLIAVFVLSLGMVGISTTDAVAKETGWGCGGACAPLK